ncbi:MAG: hypothetical protein HOP99_02385 [Dermatophilaceae bacterium]|nr:hypothetical protein [Dermatophilaceae bacterium]
MPVSSLIFVVIVAIWAAYLIQHWARRREDAAATRSVEGFSEAMRVLEKRPALPATELSTPRPHSYAIKPARVGGPTVDVKRAVPAGTSRRHSPLVARRTDEHVISAHPAETGSRPGHTDHAIAPYATEVDRMQESARQSSTTGPGRRPASAPAPVRVPLAQRRIRAALLLVALLWVPASIVLTVTGLLMWISIPFAVLTVGAVLVWLRAEAQADRLRTAKTEARDGREARGRRRHRTHDDYDWTATHVPVLSSEDTQVIRSSVSAVAVGVEEMVTVQTASTDAPAAPAPVHVEPGVFDVQAPVAGEAIAAEPEREVAPEGSWSPVPVPKPTYALKAKAEPRFTEGGIPADVFDTPEFADEAEELDDRALFARRAVSQ